MQAQNPLLRMLPCLLAALCWAVLLPLPFHEARAEVVLVQSFEHGLTPDYTVAASKPISARGKIRTTDGWVSKAAQFGKDGLRGVTYAVASGYPEAAEGTVRFHYKGGRRGVFWRLDGPEESLALAADDHLVLTARVGGKTHTLTAPFLISRRGFVAVSWKPGMVRIGDRVWKTDLRMQFGFTSVTIGAPPGAEPPEGAIDEFAVYDEWQPLPSDIEALTLAWIPDRDVDELVRRLGYAIRRAEAKGFPVSYQKVAYHVAKMAAMRFRFGILRTDAEKANTLAFVQEKCRQALRETNDILGGGRKPLHVPNPDLTGLTIRNRCFVARDGEPVLVIQPMRGPDLNSTKGITNYTRIYIYFLSKVRF
jgi:hypothetical protein